MSGAPVHLARALDYARQGYAVLPLHTPIFDDAGNCTGCSCEEYRRKNNTNYKCDNPGKHPRLKDWEGKATTDPEQIRRWWGKPWKATDAETGRTLYLYPNIGIAAGKSGLLIVDLDEYKAKYRGNALLDLEDEYTLTTRTGSGGRHLWYRMPPGAHYGNGTEGLPEGIDIRGHGGLIVAPPSLHPSGQRYAFMEGNPTPAPLPGKLCRILDAAQLNERRTLTLPAPSGSTPSLTRWALPAGTADHIHRPAPKGQRSETDFAVVCALVQAGATDGEIVDVFESYPIGTQGKYAEAGAQYLARTIANARSRVESYGEIVQKLTAALAYWTGPQGVERLRAQGFRRVGAVVKVLDVVLHKAIVRHTLRLSISTRQIGESCNCGHTSVYRYLVRLAEAGVLGLSKTEQGGTVIDLSEIDFERGLTATQPHLVGDISVAVRPLRKHDAFTHCPASVAAARRGTEPGALVPGLGDTGWLVWRALDAAPDTLTLAELVEATGLGKYAVRSVLRKLKTNGLLVVWAGRPQRYELHPGGEYKLDEQTERMTTYGMGLMRRLCNEVARGDWCQWMLTSRRRLDDDERRQFLQRRVRHDQTVITLMDALEAMGIDPTAKVRRASPRPQVLRIDPVAEWEAWAAGLVEVWDSLSDDSRSRMDRMLDYVTGELGRYGESALIRGEAKEWVNVALRLRQQMLRRGSKPKEDYYEPPMPAAPVQAALPV